MIYLITNSGVSLCVLETAHIDSLLSGEAIITPDRQFMIAYTADMKWSQQEITKLMIDGSGSVDSTSLMAIVTQGAKR